MDEREDRCDFERLQAEHPSWRLFQAHPGIGLEETEDDWVSSVSSEQLGLRWFALALDEQEAREADFLRALLEIAARDEEARFEASPARKGETSDEMVRQTGGAVLDDGAVIGRLTPQAIGPLVASRRCFVVHRCARLAVHAKGPRTLGVWTDRWKAEELERELEDAWWGPAQERERARSGQEVEPRRKRAVDRELRARVLLTWKRRSGLLIALLVFAAQVRDWHPLGWFGTPLAIAVVGVALLLALDAVVERWYRRAAQHG